jgi:hypothetical protein
LYSQKELHGKNTSQLHEMCFQKGQNWAMQPSHVKDGRVIVKEQVRIPMGPFDHGDHKVMMQVPLMKTEWKVLGETPIFTQRRDLIRNLMILESPHEEPALQAGP